LLSGAPSSLLILGTLLAWIVERTNTPFKRVAYLSAFTSFAIPGIIKVIGWIMLLGPEAGLINVLLKDLLGLQKSPFNIFTMTGMIFIEGLSGRPWYSCSWLPRFGPWIPRSKSRHRCRVQGSRGRSTHVTFKLALPSALSVLLLTFVMAIEAFEIPALVGIPGSIMVLTTEIYLKLKTGLFPQYGLASAYGVLLISFVAVGLYFYSKVTRQAQKFYTITGKGFRPRVIDVGRWRFLSTPLVLLLPACLVLPLVVLIWSSILPYYIKPSIEALSATTFGNYVTAFKTPGVFESIKNSFFVSISAATSTILFTAIIAWLVIRTNIRGRTILDQMASFTLVFPSVVLGVALLVTYLTLPIPVYGTIWILVLAYITRYIPYGIRYCYPGLLQINKELEESAQMSGAPWGMVFRKIVVPLMMPSLFCGMDLHLSLKCEGTYRSPDALQPTLPGHRGNHLGDVGFGKTGELAAFSVSVSLILVFVAALLQKLSRRYGLRV